MKSVILDQFGREIHKPRVCGFVAVPPPSAAPPPDRLADAIASTTIYPEETYEL